jgi:formylmethanofuran:tetrahydromethanopterin formyltransferase
LEVVSSATQAAIAASQGTPGLKVISAGNYDGRLGNNFIYLHPQEGATTSGE